MLIDEETMVVVYTCNPGYIFSDGTITRNISCACGTDDWANIGVSWDEAEPCLPPRDITEFCFFGSQNPSLTFSDARTACTDHSTSILSIRTPEELEYMKTNHPSIL